MKLDFGGADDPIGVVLEEDDWIVVDINPPCVKGVRYVIQDISETFDLNIRAEKIYVGRVLREIVDIDDAEKTRKKRIVVAENIDRHLEIGGLVEIVDYLGEMDDVLEELLKREYRIEGFELINPSLTAYDKAEYKVVMVKRR